MKPAVGFKFRKRWFPAAPKGKWKVPDQASDFDLFLLMGQSNMAGFGCVREDEPWQPGDFDPEPGVLVLGGQCAATSSRPRGRTVWRPAAHPLHLNQRSAGFGMGLEFARQIRQAEPGRMIGLIPGAWGGAPISKLGPGSPLYENCVRRALVAKRSGRLRGVLWHQGESDTSAEDLAASHAGKLRHLIETLRRDLDEAELPFLIGDLAEFTETLRRQHDPRPAERNAVVRAGLREVARLDPHASFVESKDLEGTDEVHFSRDALIEFGRRYAAAWLAMH